jgi:hypothetical protein
MFIYMYFVQKQMFSCVQPLVRSTHHLPAVCSLWPHFVCQLYLFRPLLACESHIWGSFHQHLQLMRYLLVISQYPSMKTLVLSKLQFATGFVSIGLPFSLSRLQFCTGFISVALLHHLQFCKCFVTVGV